MGNTLQTSLLLPNFTFRPAFLLRAADSSLVPLLQGSSQGLLSPIAYGLPHLTVVLAHLLLGLFLGVPCLSSCGQILPLLLPPPLSFMVPVAPPCWFQLLGASQTHFSSLYPCSSPDQAFCLVTAFTLQSRSLSLCCCSPSCCLSQPHLWSHCLPCPFSHLCKSYWLKFSFLTPSMHFFICVCSCQNVGCGEEKLKLRETTRGK